MLCEEMLYFRSVESCLVKCPDSEQKHSVPLNTSHSSSKVLPEKSQQIEQALLLKEAFCKWTRLSNEPFEQALSLTSDFLPDIKL